MEVLEVLRANVKNLSPGWERDTAHDLLYKSTRYTLSPKQIELINRLAQKATNGGITPNADLFPGMRRIFTNAINDGRQRFSLRMRTKDGVGVTISLASDRQRVHVAEQGVSDERRYFGFIDMNGEFRPSAKTPRDETVMEALREFDTNPIEAAIRYGQETGECCVCGRTLTNKVSVLEGIGPVCSGRL
jgi:hypothetical protein